MSTAATALVTQARALEQAGRLAEAEAAYRQLLGRWPELTDCWYNLAVVQRRAHRFEAALASYQEALARGVEHPEEVHLNRGVIYSDYLRQDEAAERELRQALALNPSYVPALLNLGNLHEDRGQRDAASALYERALAVDPACFLALARYANLQRPENCDTPLIARLRAALADPAAEAADRANLGFALGRALDAAGDYGAAFAAYASANRDSRASASAQFVPYNHTAQEQLTARLIETPLPPPVPASAAGPSTPQPIFLCGMFRSGSTLAEQLLAAHPGVAAGGELGLLPAAIAAELLPYPQALSSAPAAQLERLAQRYRASIGALSPQATWVTDKRPDNFLCIGLIKTLFPTAKIVHTRRDPLDNCLSVYFLHIDHSVSYALDLTDIGHYYREYRRVMAHWQRLFGADIIDFDYDRFVRDPQATAPALFSALGLAWDPSFLELARAQRSVRTASVWQVREPLYQRSSGRARHYARELTALRDSLAEFLPATTEGGAPS